MKDSVFLFFFFFSSRRRHTISKRDWSSDVCSSDLARRCRLPAFSSSPPLAPEFLFVPQRRPARLLSAAIPRSSRGVLLIPRPSSLRAGGLRPWQLQLRRWRFRAAMLCRLRWFSRRRSDRGIYARDLSTAARRTQTSCVPPPPGRGLL